MTGPSDSNDDSHNIYIMMKCLLSVTKIITSSLESPVTTLNHPVQLRASFHGFSQLPMVFHGSKFICMVFQVYRLVFHGFRWAFMIYHGSRLVFSWFQVGFYGFSSFQVGFSWFQVGFYVFFFKFPGWFFLVPGQFLWFQVGFS